MASPLKGARDTVTTLWQAVTPPDQTSRTYQKVTGRGWAEGAGGHRMFIFDPPSSAVLLEIGATSHHVYRYDFAARLRLSTAGAGPDAMFDRVADEGVLLMAAVNNAATWPAGVRECRVDGYQTEDTEGDDIEMVFSMVAEIEETDG